MDFEEISSESNVAVLPDMDNVYHPWCDTRIKSEPITSAASNSYNSGADTLPDTLQLMGL